jgi:two-component system response regulator
MGWKLILYAEDDQDDRFIFENSFAQHRDEVDIQMFNDGLEILNHLKASSDLNPNLIVLDINMPQVDGKDALRILRDMPSYAATPVVLLTTSSSPVDRYFAQHFNAGFITKPMDESEMDKITKELLKFCE